MPRRPKVVDIQTGLEPAPPELHALLKKLPATAKDRRAAVRKIGLAKVRRGLLAILAGCARDDFGLDGRVFRPACELLEAVGPGKDGRFLALARSGRFDDDRSSRILRAASGKGKTDEHGRGNVVEFGRKVMPALRDVLLLPGGLDGMSTNVRAHGGMAMFLEHARAEVGVPVRPVWEPVLRDPETTENVRTFAVESVAIEGTADARALLAELLPTLPADLRRRALGALNRHFGPDAGDDGHAAPDDEHTLTLRRPELHLSKVDAHGDIAITSDRRGMDGGITFAWLVVRLGVGIRRGGIRTNLSLSECSELQGDVLGYGLDDHQRPDIATIAALVDEARRARPGARFSRGTRLALQLVDREIDYGRQEARRRDPVAVRALDFDAADVAAWRRMLEWTAWLGSWFLDDGDLAALGVDKPAPDAIARRFPPSDLQGEARDAWWDAELVRRYDAVPEAWVQEVLRRLPGTPLLPRLARQLRYTAFVDGLAGRLGRPEFLTRTADAVEQSGAAAPIVRAWVERSLFPEVEDDVGCIEHAPHEYDLAPMVSELAEEATRRSGLAERMKQTRAMAMESLARAEATRFAEERPTWDEAVLEAWEATGAKRR